MPAEVDKIVFPVSIYEGDARGQTFGQVRNAFIRVVDQADGTELARYDLAEDASTETAMVFGELYRNGAEWKFRAIGQGYASGLAGIARDFGVNRLTAARDLPSPASVRPAPTASGPSPRGSPQPPGKASSCISKIFVLVLSAVTAVVASIVAFLYGSWSAVVLCLILGVLEVSLSFDNAVVNATVLERMSDFWQKIFLTIGIVIAVFGMRLVFPLLIVGITAGPRPGRGDPAWRWRSGDPRGRHGSYGYAAQRGAPADRLLRRHVPADAVPRLDLRGARAHLAQLAGAAAGPGRQARPAVGRRRAASRSSLAAEIARRGPGHRSCSPASSAWSPTSPSTGWARCSSPPASTTRTSTADERRRTRPDPRRRRPDRARRRSGGPSAAKATGKAGFFLFLYLEVLDASFSFDGVIGAFAITSDPIIIALGLGLIGAMFVRSLTVYLVRQGTLCEYVYLEHGAHWAIGALAVDPAGLHRSTTSARSSPA